VPTKRGEPQFIAFFMIFTPIFAFISVSKWWSDNPGIDQIIQIGLLIVLIAVTLFTLLMAWGVDGNLKVDQKRQVKSGPPEHYWTGDYCGGLVRDSGFGSP